MYYNRVASTGGQYVVTAEFVHWISPQEAPIVNYNMGDYKEHKTLDEFLIWCGALGIPRDKVKGLTEKNRTWSRLDTISGGGGAAPEVIAKAVNDDVARRMSS